VPCHNTGHPRDDIARLGLWDGLINAILLWDGSSKRQGTHRFFYKTRTVLASGRIMVQLRGLSRVIVVGKAGPQPVDELNEAERIVIFLYGQCQFSMYISEEATTRLSRIRAARTVVRMSGGPPCNTPMRNGTTRPQPGHAAPRHAETCGVACRLS
jgi:hypothetical protein